MQAKVLRPAEFMSLILGPCRSLFFFHHKASLVWFILPLHHPAFEHILNLKMHLHQSCSGEAVLCFVLSIVKRHTVNLREVFIFGCTQTANLFLLISYLKIIGWFALQAVKPESEIGLNLQLQSVLKKIHGYLHVIVHTE